ncbi:MAG: ROK family protein [Solirubrobacterales bacterium]
MSARGGIDLGGTKIQTAIVDADHQVLGEARRQTPTKGGPEDVAREMVGALRDAAEKAGVKPDKLAGVGVGSPGDADETTGVVSGARNLPGWSGSFPLAHVLAEDLGAPVRVGNDVQVAVEAEYHLGAGKPYRSLVGVFWGTGVGGGLMLDGKPWLGRGAAGEVGHVVVKRGGPRCSAGHPGCIEAYAGRGMMEAKARREVARGRKTKLFELMEEYGRDRLSSGIWERALHHEDELAQELMVRAEKALAAGVASIVNLLDPECVILGGGMGVRFADRYLHKIEHRMAEYLFDPEDPPAFHVAALGDLGGATGAALLVERPAA